MTFFVQSLNSHEVMPLMRLFKTQEVKKLNKTAAGKGVKPHNDPPIDPNLNDNTHHQKQPTQQRQSGIAMQSYHAIEQLPQGSPILSANQIMSSPVITLYSHDTITDALALFQTHQLRHIPVVDNTMIVNGIISDRDVLHYLGGMTEDFKQLPTSAKTNDQVQQLMKTNVLTASTDTDVRYIARLFVEQRVGAMPIVVDGQLTGIITRSDLLNAIMRHFILELWA
jgi:acetoin utilization protein AcuB